MLALSALQNKAHLCSRRTFMENLLARLNWLQARIKRMAKTPMVTEQDLKAKNEFIFNDTLLNFLIVK
jgi:hypothetical protein